MALILNIDTALEEASVCVARDGMTLGMLKNAAQKEHATWIQPAIQQLLSDLGQKITDLDAVAVTEGPGSYTGLRVGLSTAKGICFGAKIPLITENTLKMMAFAMINSTKDILTDKLLLYCPLIDARRMEVFAAIYDSTLKTVLAPCAMILDGHSFESLLQDNHICFAGNGSEKLKNLIRHSNAIFTGLVADSSHLAILSHVKFLESNFTNLSYSEPLYVKAFFTGKD